MRRIIRIETVRNLTISIITIEVIRIQAIHYTILKAHAALSRRLSRKAGELGLSSGQPKILECLSALGEADQKTIAQYCEIEPATVGSLLLRLEKAGLVQRTRHEGNRRSLFVSLTEEGKEVTDALIALFDTIDETALAGFTPEEAKTLESLLLRMHDNLRDDENETHPETSKGETL